MRNEITFAVAFAITLMPAIGSAQLVPDTTENSAVCPNRPAEPQIIANMDFRDADRVILIKRMYGAASLQSVVDTADCSCATRFPEWDQVIEYYLNHYSGIENRWEIAEATKPYGRAISQNRPAAREICIEQGNWG